MIPRMLSLSYNSILLLFFIYWCCCSSCYGWIQCHHVHHHHQQQHQYYHQSINPNVFNNVISEQLSTTGKSLPTTISIICHNNKRKKFSSLSLSSTSTVSESDATASATGTGTTTIFTTEEIYIIENLTKQFQDATSTSTTENPDSALRTTVMGSLESSSAADGSTGTIISPTLLTKLRTFEQQPTDVSSSSTSTSTSLLSSIQYVIQCLNTVQENEYTIAKETLLVLLNAGEIRKLDNIIGKAARENKLNLPFFNVLNANIRDATTVPVSSSGISETTVDDETEKVTTIPITTGIVVEPSADRLSILKHIYTRCQEELEKTIPPGIALLNKLLRTDQYSIRTNLYKHYLLVPKATTDSSDNNTDSRNVVVTPDGKIIQLQQSLGTAKSLIDINDFIHAMTNAIVQIRSLQTSNIITINGGNQMIESYKAIAKEIRLVIGNHYGPNSMELSNYQNSLQPIFCPPTSTSTASTTDSAITETETTSTTVTSTTSTSDNE